mgnify:CR=1 FL=1
MSENSAIHSIPLLVSSVEQITDHLIAYPGWCKESATIAREAKLRAKQIQHWVFEKNTVDAAEMKNLPAGLTNQFHSLFSLPVLEEVNRQVSFDGTVKYLWKLEDGNTIESVLIPPTTADSRRLTICISSQVGCAMGCKFCLTGKQTLTRNLTADEIVAQEWSLWAWESHCTTSAL